MIDSTRQSSNDSNQVDSSNNSSEPTETDNHAQDHDRLQSILKKKGNQDSSGNPSQDSSQETVLPTPQSLIAANMVTQPPTTQPTPTVANTPAPINTLNISQIAEKIVQTVQVTTNTAGTQEVTIQFAQNVLPNTSVTISMVGNQLNINFQAGSVQAASFLSESAVNQLRTEIRNRISSTSDKEVVISVEHASQSDTLTENAVHRRQNLEE